MEISLEHYNKMAERLTELEYLLAAQQWIPCTVRLPKEGEYVLVCTNEPCDFGYSNRAVGWIENGKWDIWDDRYGGGYDPVAWMPLPAPYKGGDANGR